MCSVFDMSWEADTAAGGPNKRHFIMSLECLPYVRCYNVRNIMHIFTPVTSCYDSRTKGLHQNDRDAGDRSPSKNSATGFPPSAVTVMAPNRPRSLSLLSSFSWRSSNAGPPSPTLSETTNVSASDFGNNRPNKVITRANLKASTGAYEDVR